MTKRRVKNSTQKLRKLITGLHRQRLARSRKCLKPLAESGGKQSKSGRKRNG